mmetsp:Transcript_22490/g.52452  ORF Transcript_22490/g.52452 Transcript_22490/m.52452 type:complete len:434 (+) Transcript_22490:98-1399(+)
MGSPQIETFFTPGASRFAEEARLVSQNHQSQNGVAVPSAETYTSSWSPIHVDASDQNQFSAAGSLLAFPDDHTVVNQSLQREQAPHDLSFRELSSGSVPDALLTNARDVPPTLGPVLDSLYSDSRELGSTRFSSTSWPSLLRSPGESSLSQPGVDTTSLGRSASAADINAQVLWNRAVQLGRGLPGVILPKRIGGLSGVALDPETLSFLIVLFQENPAYLDPLLYSIRHRASMAERTARVDPAGPVQTVQPTAYEDEGVRYLLSYIISAGAGVGTLPWLCLKLLSQPHILPAVSDAVLEEANAGTPFAAGWESRLDALTDALIKAADTYQLDEQLHSLGGSFYRQVEHAQMLQERLRAAPPLQVSTATADQGAARTGTHAPLIASEARTHTPLTPEGAARTHAPLTTLVSRSPEGATRTHGPLTNGAARTHTP